MRLLLYIFITVFILTAEVTAQVQTSVSNVLRYGAGKRALAGFEGRVEYFENLTDVRFGLSDEVTAGFRLLYDSPAEYGPAFSGLKRRFVEYKKNDIYLRAGNFNQLYGRGLGLNLFENRGLAFDTWMDGVLAVYKQKYFSVTVSGGTVEAWDSVFIAKTERYALRTASAEFYPVRGLKAGVAYIYAEGRIPQAVGEKRLKTEIPGLFAEYSNDQMAVYIDYSLKRSNLLDENAVSWGNGIFASFSYFKDAWSATLDYKNYRFDPRDPFERDDFGRASKALPFQNGPIVHKEHSSTLLSRAMHQVDFNDETGLQAEVNYMASDKLTLALNASLSSRHFAYVYDASNFVFKKEDASGVLPSSDDARSPFSEIYIEGEYYYDGVNSIKVSAAARKKVFYSDFTGGANSHKISSVVFPVKGQHTFSREWGVMYQAEFESVNDNYNTSKEKYNNYFSAFSLIWKGFLNGTVRYEITENPADASGESRWLLWEGGIRLNQQNTVVFSYGKERGGQVCSNGVCRYILPYKGFRLQVISYL